MIIPSLSETNESVFDGISERTFLESDEPHCIECGEIDDRRTFDNLCSECFEKLEDI